jgi:uncharacterized lipoprotein NlpE involved in copper resistance
MVKKLISLVIIICLCSLVGCHNQSIPEPTDKKYDLSANGSFDAKGSIKIQLIGSGNEKEEPFLVKEILSNASNITIFTLEDGSTRIINCEYKEVK